MNVEVDNKSTSSRKLQHDNSDMTHLLANDKSEKTMNFAILRNRKISPNNSGNLQLAARRVNSETSSEFNQESQQLKVHQIQ